MAGIYKGSTKLGEGDITFGGNDAEVYYGNVKIFPDVVSYSVTVSISGTLTGCTRSATSLVIPSGESRTFTVNANSGYEFNSSGDSSATESSQYISVSESFSGGVFTYTVTASTLTANQTASITNTATATLQEYTFTINFTDNTGSNMAFSTTPVTYTGTAGTTFSGSRTATYSSGYEKLSITATDNSALITTTTSNNDTVNWSGSIPIGGSTQTITVGGAAQNSEFTASFVGTNNIVGDSSNYTVSNLVQADQTGFTGTAYTFNDLTATADEGYEFTSGPITSGDSVSGTFANADVTINRTISGTVVASTRTVTLASVNNIASTNASFSASSVSGVIGSTVDVTLTILTSDTDRYYSTFPSLSGLEHAEVISTVHDTPVFSGVPNDFIRRTVYTLRVTIPSTDQTETITIDGATATVKQVQWATKGQNISHNANSNFSSLTFYSLDPEGEPPTVYDDAGWILVGNVSYSGGVGTAELSAQSNNSTNSRTASITVESSIDGSTDSYDLVQAAAPVVIATSATWSDDTSKASPLEIDTSAGDGDTTASFTTVPLDGLVQITTIGLPSDVTVSLSNAQNRVTIRYTQHETDTFRVLLHPQGDTSTVLDTLWVSLMSGA